MRSSNVSGNRLSEVNQRRRPANLASAAAALFRGRCICAALLLGLLPAAETAKVIDLRGLRRTHARNGDGTPSNSSNLAPEDPAVCGDHALCADKLREARVVFLSCIGYRDGGPQLRCLETARAMRARGVPALCVTNCFFKTLRLIVEHARRPLQAVVIVKASMGRADIEYVRRELRPITCNMLHDTMDLNPKIHWTHKMPCYNGSYAQMLTGVIANNEAAWQHLRDICPALSNATQAGLPVHTIEHFHSVTRRVSDGDSWPSKPRALLVMEHHAEDSSNWGFCTTIRQALPPEVDFNCAPLWSGKAANSRLHFFTRELNLTRNEVHERMSRPMGTGELFTAVFARYHLLLQWHASNSAQRLLNALATGVPVVAKTNAAFRAVLPRTSKSKVLLVSNHSELFSVVAALAASNAYRRQVSDAGVALANLYSVNRTVSRYLSAFRVGTRACQRTRQFGSAPSVRR